jgi:CheY-like chemotaxis protein
MLRFTMRVLVVDDDPISLRYLHAALAQMACEPTPASTFAAALAAVSAQEFDLLLLDRRMPEGSGTQLLARLRERGCRCPAVATSAEISGEIAVQLRAEGFVACIEKPVSLARLREVLQPWLRPAASVALEDDAALVAVGGDQQTLIALRGMLATEICTLLEDLAQYHLGAAALLERLHRLRAACGFCGASKLAAAAAEWERALRSGSDADAHRHDFAACCGEALQAMAG